MTDMAGKTGPTKKLYLGVDVGGTKILGVLARANGRVVARKRTPTPRGKDPKQTVRAIVSLVRELIAESGAVSGAVQAVGVAVPGVIDPTTGTVVVTPNMNLTGVKLGPAMEGRFSVPVALGNDVSLGTLAETWLGSASSAGSAVGIFIGTGIGGGIVIDNRLVTGCRNAAAEVGHMIVQADGPLCGCGANGCLEAVASRTAIERDIRQAVARGRKTVLTELLGKRLGQIKSGALREALNRRDRLVTKVLTDASEALGRACLSVRHLLDPEVIVLGGGVIEACGAFILPIVERIWASDSIPGAGDAGRVVVSSLGDDAVALGAVVIAQEALGKEPLEKAMKIAREYPRVSDVRLGELTVGARTFNRDVFIRVDGKTRRRELSGGRDAAAAHRLSAEELARVCRGGPALLVVGAGHTAAMKLDESAETFCRRRGIEVRVMATPAAAKAYNASRARRAAVFHVGC